MTETETRKTALDALVETVAAGVHDPSMQNGDREFLCRWVVENAKDMTAQFMWEAYYDEFLKEES
ncbi:MAG: hypothetical protein L0K30_00215 [Acidipropionibacterium jensenii]|uniref:hypothetical protein n=1 Tax=Acidipropionibacterium jensenii TaxID=1749 RepID=UPI0026477339|nr:hypothetical protein [Acidipropionibacterium jensenii]MDN6440456.1 hypothetical protein [Acidipropionibacterium jensenii]